MAHPLTNPLGRYATGDDGASGDNDDLVTVRLLAAPLKIWLRAKEHHDELMREMALLALSSGGHELPRRLLELVEILGRQYGAAGGKPDAERDAAMRAGLDRVDLTYVVARSSSVSAAHMRALLDEAEAYCGDDLLTLAQPADQAAFSTWYMDQFVQQSAGQPPTPWPGPWT